MGRRSLCHGDGYIETLVIYGIVSDPETVAKKIRPLPEGASYDLSNQHALFTENSPALRLSSEGWMHFSPNALIEASNFQLLYDLTIEKIMRGIPPFSQSTRIFINSYLKFMSKQTREITTTDSDADIFSQEDWIYSIWLPMPNTNILLSPGFNNEELNFAEFDLSFWTGKKLICIQLNQSNTPVKSKRNRIEYLGSTHPHIKIIEIPSNRLTNIDPAFPDDLFDENFSRFWRGLKLPQGPNTQPIFASSL